MTHTELLGFMRQSPYWVEATVGPTGAAQASVVGVVVTDELELFFDTLKTTRKYKNLRRDTRMAFVMWEGECTVQYEGVADEPRDEELARLKDLYFGQFRDGPKRERWSDIAYVRVKPTWLRFSDFRGETPRVMEMRYRQSRTSGSYRFSVPGFNPHRHGGTGDRSE
ncbi:MAG TPA: pyridoxamine 5'-phosphate oxidase family protein [Anaeromyxobacteraceae bacterium]|nr:pyridoxamine 5'-phosphate oxidase family protein [Anaeromyxobacteraceae bacterium]